MMRPKLILQRLCTTQAGGRRKAGGRRRAGNQAGGRADAAGRRHGAAGPRQAPGRSAGDTPGWPSRQAGRAQHALGPRAATRRWSPPTCQLCVQLDARLARSMLPLLERHDGHHPLLPDAEVLGQRRHLPPARKGTPAGRRAGERRERSAGPEDAAVAAADQIRSAHTLLPNTFPWAKPWPLAQLQPPTGRQAAKPAITSPRTAPPARPQHLPPSLPPSPLPHPCLACISYMSSLASSLSSAFFQGSAARPSVRSTPQLI